MSNDPSLSSMYEGHVIYSQEYKTAIIPVKYDGGQNYMPVNLRGHTGHLWILCVFHYA